MGDVREMTVATAVLPRTRRAYDHRLREQVVRCGAKVVARHLQIPRSTASTWRRRGWIVRSITLLPSPPMSRPSRNVRFLAGVLSDICFGCIEARAKWRLFRLGSGSCLTTGHDRSNGTHGYRSAPSLLGSSHHCRLHFLNCLPPPHGHGSFGPTLGQSRRLSARAMPA